MGLVIGGPVAVAVSALTGGRRTAALGTVMAAATAAVMADMIRQPVVPGANDNLSGVAVLLEVARRLRDAPPPDGVRVILLSAGAEEANQEGMLAFARRHFPRLSPESHLVPVPRHRRLARVGVDRGRGLPADVRVPVRAEGARRRRGPRRRRHRPARHALHLRHRRAGVAAPGLPGRQHRLGHRVPRAGQLPLADRHGRQRGLRVGGTTAWRSSWGRSRGRPPARVRPACARARSPRRPS